MKTIEKQSVEKMPDSFAGSGKKLPSGRQNRPLLTIY